MSKHHGLSGSPEYKVWSSMKQRCLNPNEYAYPRYGGRGITVSENWLLFSNFYREMGGRPSPLHTLERRDNNLGYSADNCYWALPEIQSRNKRNNVVISFNGKSMTIADWSLELGIKPNVIGSRHRRGLPFEQVLYKGNLQKDVNIYYNKAINDAKNVVASNTIYGHTVVNGVIDNIIRSLEKLKKLSK